MVKAKKKIVRKSLEKPTEKEPRISFESLEFPHHAKNELWYIGIGLLLLVGLFASISIKNYLFALVVVAAGVAIFRLAHLKPGSRQVEVTPRGVLWGDQFWGYHQLKNFWISEVSGAVTVYIERPNLKPMLHFSVPDHQVEQVLLALSLELPFHAHKDEPIPDRFARLLRI